MTTSYVVNRVDLATDHFLTWQAGERCIVIKFHLNETSRELRTMLRRNITAILDNSTNRLRSLTIDFTYDSRAVPPFIKEVYYNREEKFLCIFFVNPDTQIDGKTVTQLYLESRVLLTHVDNQLITIHIPNIETTI